MSVKHWTRYVRKTHTSLGTCYDIWISLHLIVLDKTSLNFGGCKLMWGMFRLPREVLTYEECVSFVRASQLVNPVGELLWRLSAVCLSSRQLRCAGHGGVLVNPLAVISQLRPRDVNGSSAMLACSLCCAAAYKAATAEEWEAESSNFEHFCSTEVS